MKKHAAFLLAIVFFLLTNAYADDARQTPIVKIVKDNSGAVVTISTEKTLLLQENPFWGDYGNDINSFFRQFYGTYPVPALKLKSVGSGVIIDKKGIIVTNAHVVNMATNIFVILNDGTQVKGELKYENTDSDLAIVTIDPPKPLQEARIGETNDLMLGETAIAIGNPYGLENSVSSGIISGKNRTLYSTNGQAVLSGLIQTDTPINPGNSGGALLNLDGELIGINTAMVQNSQGIGFAIPVEKVKEMLKNYREHKNLATQYQYQPQTAPGQTSYQSISSVKLDMKETKNAYLLSLDIKGLDKNKIDIEVKQNSITISNSSGMSSFAQTIPMPQDVNTQGVTTKTNGDTLLITLPKK